MLFIHGVGNVGETVEVLTSPAVLEAYQKDLADMKLHLDMEFNPVTMYAKAHIHTFNFILTCNMYFCNLCD